MKAPTHEILARRGWPWKAENRAGCIILVSDEQFRRLAESPGEAVEKTAPWKDAPESLRDFCRDAAEAGCEKIMVAYDYFFGGSTRGLYPDSPEFLENMKKIHDVAREHGLGIEPSVLSPLELGYGYTAATGESGRWMQYAEGLRDPETGRWSVSPWKHSQWVNNKGPTPVKLTGVRAFAFKEMQVPGTVYHAVDRADIVELPAPSMEEYPGTRPVGSGAPEVAEQLERQFRAVATRIWGDGPVPGRSDTKSFNRVLVVLCYDTVEMDYLSPAAPPFLKDLVGRYHSRGVSLTGLYSDEMHIQQDWTYHHHLDQGQFTMRYVSKGFEKAFAERFGARYADFAPWLVYFTCHQHRFLATHEPVLPSQHVFGSSPEDIAATLRFRRDYYRFLETSVVDLVNGARTEIERLQGAPLDAFYHSTWAESPTCDLWSVDGAQRDWAPDEHKRKYEYTPEFVWSNTVQQAAAACADYFAWNTFLTGGNNDVPEGGYADRDYYGRALAVSLADLNRSPLASCGMWGMPGPMGERMTAVSETFGALGHASYRAVQDYTGRSIEVLFLYPQDLVAVDERFGSWMAQYGYANYVNARELAARGRVLPGGVLECGRSRYRTVCVLYDPFMDPDAVKLLRDFVAAGGTLVWSSVPPQPSAGGTAERDALLADLFGIRLDPTTDPFGRALPARAVEFTGALSGVSAMPILTHFIVDSVFPVQVLAGTETVATVRPGGSTAPYVVGACKRHASGGRALYLGFRPRDDQAGSTGTESRAWFEILDSLDAYPGGGTAGGAEQPDDNPTVVSRTTEYLACAFPNGSLAVCPHYRDQEEGWPGGFFRDEKVDAQVVKDAPPPSDQIRLERFAVAGQVVSFTGRHAVAWRVGTVGLVAFSGRGCTGITIDARAYKWSTAPVDIAWHPLEASNGAPGITPLYRVWCGSAGAVQLPLDLMDEGGLEVLRGAFVPAAGKKEASGRFGFGDESVPFTVKKGSLCLDMKPELVGYWLYVIRRS